MKTKITSRDIKFFFIGVFTIIIIDLFLNWNEFKQGFIDDFNKEINNTQIKNSK